MLRIKVTKIDNRWHARLFNDTRIVNELACSDKRDIGWICREMLTWFDKLGGSDPWASAARERHTESPKGKIFYHQN